MSNNGGRSKNRKSRKSVFDFSLLERRRSRLGLASLALQGNSYMIFLKDSKMKVYGSKQVAKVFIELLHLEGGI